MTYFSKLFQYNKRLCLAVTAFCALLVVVNLLKVETTPAFIWGMYSEKEVETKEYRILKIVVNDSVIIDYSAKYADATRFYLLSPLTYYWAITENGQIDPEESFYRRKLGKYFGILNPVKNDLFNDSVQQPVFMKWYSDYLEGATHIKINRLDVDILNLVYNKEGRPEIRRESTFSKWRRQ